MTYENSGALCDEHSRLEHENALNLVVYLAEQSRPIRESDDTVLMVGAGVVNLITALQLVRSNRRVEIIDRTEDPLEGAQWNRMGCSFSGFGARVFSLTEARQHHLRLDGDTNKAYRHQLSDGGWLDADWNSLDGSDKEWIRRHESIQGSLLDSFGDDLERFNVESYPFWRRLIETRSDLFRDADLVDRLVRLYPTEDAIEAAIEREESLGYPPKRLSLDSLVTEAPALSAAVARGEVAGALKVGGFSLNIHAFCTNLVRRLLASGARFRWGVDALGVRRTSDGRVCAIQTTQGAISARSYVISPGAYGGDLLEGFNCEGQIAAMHGAWVSLVDEARTLRTPLKIGRRGFGANDFAQGANVIPIMNPSGGGYLRVSSGHGFTGVRPTNMTEAHLKVLMRAAWETAERYFPEVVAQQSDPDWAETTARHCIRPWTPTGLGLFETAPTDKGGACVITGGHNTGGFAQAPEVASAVAAALNGETHKMHYLYNPLRCPPVGVTAADIARPDSRPGADQAGPEAL